MTPGRPAISAHRGGRELGPHGTYEAYRAAIEAGTDYVEFDVRRTADGALVACHEASFGRERLVSGLSLDTLRGAAGYQVPQVADLLGLLAGRARAHIDLKEPDTAQAVIEMALGAISPEDMVVTTGDMTTALAIKQQHRDVPVGLTVGGNLAQTARFLARRMQTRGLSRLADVVTAGADRAVIHRPQASERLLAECRGLGIGTMVWTVNRRLAHWLARSDLDILVTDRPARAISLRAAASRTAT
jgi:glycerophosphoryl diester phosphodiesterase